MIISKIQGGLGNQMFQWAFARKMSIEYGLELFLDLSFFENQYFNGVQRNFELDKFGFPIKKTQELKISDLRNMKFRTIPDKFEYIEIFLDPNENYYFDGYWQSEKYFKDFSDEIISNFSVPIESKKYISSLYPDLDQTLSIHVRRSDYLLSNGYHPIQDIKYYDSALEKLGVERKILVFSDDLDWCKSNLKYPRIGFCDHPSDLVQLWIMSMCHSNIIANSSFSWWAAWLNQNPNKQVIAPKNWFGPKTNLSSKDIIPDGWIII